MNKIKSLMFFIIFCVFSINIYSATSEKEYFLEGISYFEQGKYDLAYDRFLETHKLLGKYTARVTPYLVLSKWNESQIDNKRILLTELYSHVKALEQFDLSDSIFTQELKIIQNDVYHSYDLLVNKFPQFIKQNNEWWFEHNKIYSSEKTNKKIIGSKYYKYYDLGGVFNRLNWGLYYSANSFNDISDENIEEIKKGLNFKKDDLEYRYGFQNFSKKYIGEYITSLLFSNIDANLDKSILSLGNQIAELKNDEYTKWYNNYTDYFTGQKYIINLKTKRDQYLNNIELAKIEKRTKERLRIERNDKLQAQKNAKKVITETVLPLTMTAIGGILLLASDDDTTMLSLGAGLAAGGIYWFSLSW